MSWIRNAVNLAVEAGATNSLTRTVRNYADSVVLHAGNAVAGGARLLLPDRIGLRNLQSFRHTVKRLEEVSVSCRGVERVQLLRRWLDSLKEIERLSTLYNANNEKGPEDQLNYDESMESLKRPTLVYYIDSDTGDEPKTFRDVFLHSQALEGITLSMILEEPNEEEVSLLLEIYGLCLTGGKQVHNVVMSSVQNLAAALAYYQDEVLIKREELLQFAQGAIAGLKINADLARIDSEACSIREELDKIMAHQKPLSEGCEKSSEKARDETVENLKEALVEIQLCSRLEALLLKKKSLRNGDSPEMHTEKVEKLKVLTESLANSTSQAEKRILDHRYQKEEALNYRVAKANEVSQLEKELVAEIGQLERQREELQQELKKDSGSHVICDSHIDDHLKRCVFVNKKLFSLMEPFKQVEVYAYVLWHTPEEVIISLNGLRARLHNAREEREQFDEASNQILVHIKSKEDELSRSIYSCKAEVDVVNAWISFLEDTWLLQTSYTEKKEKQVNGELERYGDYFVNLVIQLLSTYKESLGSSITRIKNLAESLNSSLGANISPGIDDGSSKVGNPRKKLEEEYLDMEAKFLTTLSVVETMKKQFYVQTEGIFRRDDHKVKELFDAVKQIKDEFEFINRPILEIEASPRRPETPSSDRPHISPSPTSTSPLAASPLTTGTPEFKQDEVSNSSLIKVEKKLDPKEEMAKPGPQLGKVVKEDSKEELAASPLTTGTPEFKQDEVSNSSLIEVEKKLDPKEEMEKLEPQLGKVVKEDSKEELAASQLTTGTPEFKQDEVSNSSLIKVEKKLDPKEEMAKLEPQLGKVVKEVSDEEVAASPLTTGTPKFKQDEVSNSSLIKVEKKLDPKEEMAKHEPQLGKVVKEDSKEELAKHEPQLGKVANEDPKEESTKLEPQLEKVGKEDSKEEFAKLEP